MDTVLVVHAAVAPLAFGLLGWHHFRRHPGAAVLPTAAAMLAIVVALDALVVAPLFEHSYAMFRSFAGTWLPFGLIFGATYLAGRMVRRAKAGAAT
jgi:drug/metabolite transporter superfamily protein YnfA